MVEYDPVRFKTGLAAALCSKARAFPKREPVAFFYGHKAKEGEEIPDGCIKRTINGEDYVGAVLPDIYKVYTLELEAQYPYLVANNGRMWLLDKEVAFRGTGKGLVVPQIVANWKYCSYDESSGSWNLSNTVAGTSNGNTNIASQYVIWANFDIEGGTWDEEAKVFTPDGTTFIAACDHIPIYE